MPLARRWWTWAVVLALVAAATLGGLAWSSAHQAEQPFPALHVGNLAKRPDEEFLRFLPARTDFPPTLNQFTMLTADQLREHPEPAIETDPPGCGPTAVLRGPDILGEVRTGTVLTAAYTFAVTRETAKQNLVGDLRGWLDRCAQAELPAAGKSSQARRRTLSAKRLPDPDIGADRALAYSITIADTAGDGSGSVLYPPQTHVMTLAVVRGVALYCLARNTNVSLGEPSRNRLLSTLVRRIRAY